MASFRFVILCKPWGNGYVNRRRPPCTTMPWSIWPALVVLWGVCWMFYNSPPPADISGPITFSDDYQSKLIRSVDRRHTDGDVGVDWTAWDEMNRQGFDFEFDFSAPVATPGSFHDQAFLQDQPDLQIGFFQGGIQPALTFLPMSTSPRPSSTSTSREETGSTSQQAGDGSQEALTCERTECQNTVFTRKHEWTYVYPFSGPDISILTEALGST